MPAETATILVTDLVDSTGLRATLGEDRAEELRREHDRMLAGAAERAGGTVVKGLGDGLLVRFPGAAEAVAAAVEMQQGVESLGRRRQLDLAIRVGLSAGDVTSEDGDCFGTPVIEASRLCDEAAGGEILAAEVVTVLGRGRGGHDVTAQGSRSLKGLADPVAVARIEWEAARTVADLRGEAPYVGREDERGVLRERFAAAAGGQGGVVLIAGEPGIGKTRLVTELCAEVTADPGATVLIGGCHDGDVAAYAPFVEAFGDWVRATPSDDVGRLLGAEGPVIGRIVPAVHDVVPDLAEPPALAADEATARLHDAVVQVAARLADEAPLVLVLDDLHWADTASIGLMRAVARRAPGLRVLIVGTYRDTDLDRRHPLAEALPLLRREVEPTRLALDGLAPAAVRELLEQLAEHEVPEAFAGLLAAQSEGNPFFLREMLLHLVDEGALRFEDGAWVAEAGIETIIPEGVREVVGRRLSALSDPAERLLGVGALFEAGFPLPVAAQVAELEEGEALDAIDEALEAQVVRPTDVFDQYVFAHALFRQTLVEELNPSRQVRRHRAIAEAYEKALVGAPTPADAAVLVRHWHLSAALPGAERGVPAALLLAGGAEDRYAHQEVFDALTVAVELLPEGDEREAGLRLRRAEAAALARVGSDEAVAEAAQASGLVAADEGRDAAADAVAGVVRRADEVGEVECAWALAAVGRGWLDPSRRDATWARLRYAELNEQEWGDPDFPGIPVDSPERRELQEVLERLDPDERAYLPVWPSSRDVARAMMEADPSRGSWLFPAWYSGDVRTMVEVCAAAATGAAEQANLTTAALAYAVEARCHTVLGDHARADRSLAAARALLPRIPPTSNGAFQVAGAEILVPFVRGRRMSPMGLEPLRELSENPTTRWAALSVIAGEALALADSGDPSACREVIDRVMVGVERAPGHAPNYPLIACIAADALWVLGEPGSFGALERNLRTKVVEPDIRYPEVDARLALAKLSALDGRSDEARRWLEASRQVVEEQRTGPLLVRVDLTEAEMELRLAADGDPENVAACLASARSWCDDPAMEPWLERIAELEEQAARVWPA